MIKIYSSQYSIWLVSSMKRSIDLVYVTSTKVKHSSVSRFMHLTLASSYKERIKLRMYLSHIFFLLSSCHASIHWHSECIPLRHCEFLILFFVASIKWCLFFGKACGEPHTYTHFMEPVKCLSLWYFKDKCNTYIHGMCSRDENLRKLIFWWDFFL